MDHRLNLKVLKKGHLKTIVPHSFYEVTPHMISKLPWMDGAPRAMAPPDTAG